MYCLIDAKEITNDGSGLLFNQLFLRRGFSVGCLTVTVVATLPNVGDIGNQITQWFATDATYRGYVSNHLIRDILVEFTI